MLGRVHDRGVADVVGLPASVSCPEIGFFEAIFTPGEWRSVYRVVNRKEPPKEPPKLQEMVRMVGNWGATSTIESEDEPARRRCGWDCSVL